MCIEYNQLCPETSTWKSKRNQAPNEVSDCSTGNKDFRFCNRKRNPKTDFTSNKSVLMVDFDYEILIWTLWISFLPFDWEIRKRICKTILVNSGLLFANDACACKTAVFEILFRISQKKRKEREWKNRYLIVEIRFQISRSIANQKSWLWNLKLNFHIKGTLVAFSTSADLVPSPLPHYQLMFITYVVNFRAAKPDTCWVQCSIAKGKTKAKETSVSNWCSPRNCTRKGKLDGQKLPVSVSLKSNGKAP